MLAKLSSLARSGLVAVAAIACIPAAASAAPIAPSMPAFAGSTSTQVIPVRGEGRDSSANPVYRRNWPRYNAPRNWNGRHGIRDGRDWRRNGNWRGGNRYWRNHGWRGNHYRGGWNRGWGPGWGWGSGIYLNLNVPDYDYYDVPYRPRAYPRAAYRGGNAHVEWCYARYRSYRAYDNSYQPYNGPRRACISPYG